MNKYQINDMIFPNKTKWETGYYIRLHNGKYINYHSRFEEMTSGKAWAHIDALFDPIALTLVNAISNSKIENYDNFGLMMRPCSINDERWIVEYKPKFPTTDNRHGPWARFVAVWMVDKLRGELNYRNLTIDSMHIDIFKQILRMRWDDAITDEGAIQLIRFVLDDVSYDVVKLATEHNLFQVSDDNVLLDAVILAISDSEKAIEDYNAGNLRAVNSIVGKVMKTVGKTADARIIMKMVEDQLKSYRGIQ